MVSYLVGCSKYGDVKEKLEFAFPNYMKCNVVKVVDGNTFDCQLNNIQIESVKLIGVKIPSSFKHIATDFSRSYLRRGLPLKLEPDEDTTDGINVLAYVYLPGGQMLNALLLEEGYAEYDAKPPNLKYEEYFLRLEDEAKAESRGFWGKNN